MMGGYEAAKYLNLTRFEWAEISKTMPRQKVGTRSNGLPIWAYAKKDLDAVPYHTVLAIRAQTAEKREKAKATYAATRKAKAGAAK